jgi:nucleoid-associated protein YgaU
MLGTVAHKFNVTIKAIEAANPGIDSTRLKIDSTINIPTPSATGSSSIERPTIAIGGSPATHPSRSARNSSSGTSVASTTGGAIKAGAPYTVKNGDTLGTIALEAYGSKNAWQRIFRANRSEIGDPNLVREGTILRIPN